MIGSDPIETRNMFVSRSASPVGRIDCAGYMYDTWRKFDTPMRRLDFYAMVFVLEGGGRFKDSLGSNLEVEEGDILLLFPGIPHGYGPVGGKKWSEMYAHFDGPVFDLWRERSMINPEHPVVHLPNAVHWRSELHALFSAEIEGDKIAQTVQVCRFLTMLTEIVASGTTLNKESDLPRWLQSAFDSLDPSVQFPSMDEIARRARMPYSTFRKRFKTETGKTPAQYRAQLQMQAAQSLLTFTNAPMREIAAGLNFNDEFHFSKRFKAAFGIPPSSFRKRMQTRDGSKDS